MTCADAEILICDYLDGTLDAAARAGVLVTAPEYIPTAVGMSKPARRASTRDSAAPDRTTAPARFASQRWLPM